MQLNNNWPAPVFILFSKVLIQMYYSNGFIIFGTHVFFLNLLELMFRVILRMSNP